MIKNIKWLLFASLSFVACNDDDTAVTEEPVTPGSANFSKYVALGDSFAAGFSDGALFLEGQKNAYPNILAKQFIEAGGAAVFNSPWCGTDNLGGLKFGGNVIQGTRLYFNGTSPVNVAGVPVTEVTTKVTGALNNFGVPGAKSYHLLAAGYGNPAGVPSGLANPYFARFSSSSSATVLADALTQQPTFFSLWIGGNDVLGYAMSGGTGVDQTGNLDPTTYGGSDITDPTVFKNVYNGLVTQLLSNNKKGVIANLPYINTLPHFTTVPVNPLTSSVLGGGNVAVGEATIDALNAQLYGPLKQALTAFGAGDRINLLSKTTANPLLIKDETLTNLSAQITAALTPALGGTQAAFFGSVFGQARQAKTKEDFALLTTQGLIGAAPSASNSGLGFAPPAPLNKFGITYPLQDGAILTKDEVSKLKVATDAYNLTIDEVVAANDGKIAFVDARAIMNQLVNGGIRFGNYHMTASFVTGGTFSLDGIHPSARGYALIANKFIEAINKEFGSTLKTVDLSTYRIQYPASL